MAAERQSQFAVSQSKSRELVKMLHEQGILGSEPIPSWVGLPASAWDEPLGAEEG